MRGTGRNGPATGCHVTENDRRRPAAYVSLFPTSSDATGTVNGAGAPGERTDTGVPRRSLCHPSRARKNRQALPVRTFPRLGDGQPAGSTLSVTHASERVTIPRDPNHPNGVASSFTAFYYCWAGPGQRLLRTAGNVLFRGRPVVGGRRRSGATRPGRTRSGLHPPGGTYMTLRTADGPRRNRLRAAAGSGASTGPFEWHMQEVQRLPGPGWVTGIDLAGGPPIPGSGGGGSRNSTVAFLQKASGNHADRPRWAPPVANLDPSDQPAPSRHRLISPGQSLNAALTPHSLAAPGGAASSHARKPVSASSLMASSRRVPRCTHVRTTASESSASSSSPLRQPTAGDLDRGALQDTARAVGVREDAVPLDAVAVVAGDAVAPAFSAGVGFLGDVPAQGTVERAAGTLDELAAQARRRTAPPPRGPRPIRTQSERGPSTPTSSSPR